MEQDIYDGAWKLFDHDPATGRTIWMLVDGDKTHFRIDMPVGAILDANHDAEMETMGKRFGDYNRIASIPTPLFYQNGLSQAVKQKDDGWLKRWLNDGDHKKFRTSRGSV